MIVGQLQLPLGHEHPVRHDPANGALFQSDAGAGDVGADGREHADHAGPGVGRAADDLDRRLAWRNLDLAHAQAIRIRMLFGLEDARDGKRRQLLRGIVDAFNLEPDRGQLLRDLFERGVRIEMVLEPGQSEFHCVLRPAGLEGFPAYPGAFGVCVLPRLRGRRQGLRHSNSRSWLLLEPNVCRAIRIFP